MKAKRPSLPRNAERIDYDDLLRKLMEVVFVYRGIIRVTILKNIALVTYALLTLFHGARGGNGWLSQAALARCLPLKIGPKEREQRLHRFLENLRFTPEVMIPLHVALAVGTQLRERLPMILDQTTIRGVETLLIGVVFEGRVLPIAFTCFMKKFIHKSQNILEHSLILAAMSCFPVEFCPLLILDRGYARVALFIDLREEGIPFLCRAKRSVMVYLAEQRKGKTLGRFKIKPGQLRRYSVLYHSQKKEPLDLIIYWGKGYEEPWYLLVPSETSLTAEEIVELYAKRMSIEQGFRDWKTHLGVRGLVFKGDNPAPRLTRLLLAFSLSYLLCVALGAVEGALIVRAFVEIERHKPRHGTTRTLSVLSIGILRLSLKKFSKRAHRDLLKMLCRLSQGKGVIQWCLSPPKPVRLSSKR
ncbi:MAG: IS4/IS5 family transposase [Deltaproteobacteria bacterium]|nr:MAG: IS4/IS5 family transposase [Deltaproteobacteria bacterium]